MEFFTPGHLIVIAIVALVLFFGWKNLPDMARSVGRSLRVFKTEIKGMNEDDKAREAVHEPKEIVAKPAEPAPVAAAKPVPRAEFVPQRGDGASAPAPVRARPRPAPSPNGRSTSV